MKIIVRPLAYAIGAEITGVDLGRPLSDETWNQIHDAWLKHIVLVFPGQKLTSEQQVAFAARFGPLDDHHEDPDPTTRLPGFPEIYLLGNYKADGVAAKTRNFGNAWHTDHSYTTRPTKVSMLYCRSVPPVGGTTAFSNGYLAYETLSDGLRALVDNTEGIHDIARNAAEAGFTNPDDPSFSKLMGRIERLRKKHPPVAHPLVRVHPETGRKALYLNRMMMRSLVGWRHEESEGLVRYLYEHAARPEFTYRHTYKVDDLLFWDNRCSLHNALVDYDHDPKHPRLMNRLSVLGEPHGRVLQYAA